MITIRVFFGVRLSLIGFFLLAAFLANAAGSNVFYSITMGAAIGLSLIFLIEFAKHRVQRVNGKWYITRRNRK